MLRDSILPENPHWIAWVAVIVVALLAMATEVVFASLAQLSNGWFRWLSLTIALACAFMSVMANNFVMSRNETQSIAATAQGELIKTQISSLQQQVTVQNEILAKCPPTHQKNCIAPATEIIGQLNSEIAKLTQSLQHQAVSRTHQWAESWSKAIDLPVDVKGIFNFAISLILEITMIALGSVLFSSNSALNRSDPVGSGKSHHLHLNVDNVVIGTPTVPAESTVYPVDSTRDNSDVVQGGVQSKVQYIAKQSGKSIEEVRRILSSDEGLGKVRKIFNVGMDTVRQARKELGIPSTK